MSQADSEDGDTTPAEELANIVSSFRAFLEWSHDVGTTGLPRDPQAKEKALAIAASLGPINRHVATSPQVASVARPASGQVQSTRPTVSHKLTQPKTTPQQEKVGLKKAKFQVPSFEDEPKDKVASKSVVPQKSTKKHWELPPEIAQLNAPQLQEKIESFYPESEHTRKVPPIILRGSAASGLCFVADTSPPEDNDENPPFMGEAGELLDRMLKGMGLEQDEAAVLLLTKFASPDGGQSNREQSLELLQYLHRYLQLMRPKVIVTLGAHVTNALLGTQMPISKLRGQFRLYAGKVALMPTFHPAYLLKAPSAKRDVWFDLKQVLQHLGRDIPVSK